VEAATYSGQSLFHRCRDEHPNTLMAVLDKDGNMFGGFTPVKWESIQVKSSKEDPAERFALKAEKLNRAIWCSPNQGPAFFGIRICGNSNANANGGSQPGLGSINATGLDGKTFFTGLPAFQVKEIEVFETTPYTARSPNLLASASEIPFFAMLPISGI
jgi:hypothetical protein